MSVRSQGGAARDPRGSPLLLGMEETRGPPCLAVRAQHRVACPQLCTRSLGGSGHLGSPLGWGCPKWVLACVPREDQGLLVELGPPQCHFKGDLQIFHCCRRAPCALCHRGVVDFGAPSLPGSGQGSTLSVRVLNTHGEPVPPVSPFPLPSRRAEGFES